VAAETRVTRPTACGAPPAQTEKARENGRGGPAPKRRPKLPILSGPFKMFCHHVTRSGPAVALASPVAGRRTIWRIDRLRTGVAPARPMRRAACARAPIKQRRPRELIKNQEAPPAGPPARKRLGAQDRQLINLGDSSRPIVADAAVAPKKAPGRACNRMLCAASDRRLPSETPQVMRVVGVVSLCLCLCLCLCLAPLGTLATCSPQGR
jgi:hypothetical protein